MMLNAAMHNRLNESVNDVETRVLADSAIAPTTLGSAICRRRSRNASELREINSMPSAPNVYGISDSTPICATSLTPIDLMMVGNQKLNV